MSNTTDITNCTDRVLDIFLRTKGGEDGIDCDLLTVTERGQLADLMKWERTSFLSYWIQDAPADIDPADKDGDTFDYEGAILDQADARDGDYL